MINVSDQLFPNLSKIGMSSCARRWVKEIGEIEKITLYNYPNHKVYCYAVVLQLSYSVPRDPDLPIVNDDALKIHYTTPLLPSEVRRHIDVFTNLTWFGNDKPQDADFRKVYKDGKPPEDYQAEWFFYPMYQDEEMPEFVGEDSWQLYPDAEENAQARILDAAAIIVLREARKIRKNNAKMNKVQAKEIIDSILERNKLSPYSRSQFNRIIKPLGFPPAPRGRKPSKTNQ